MQSILSWCSGLLILTPIVEKKSSAQNKIAINYLKERFWIDLFATIPFDTIVELIFFQTTKEFQTFGILKLIRIARINKLVAYMNVKEDTKIYLNLVKLLFYLSIYFHILGCFWYYIVSQSKVWIPPLDTIYPVSTFFNRDLWYQYWMAIYHAVLIETANDIAPRIETIQVVFCTLMIVIGAVVNAYIFGLLIAYVAEMNSKTNEFVQKLDTCNNAMRNLKIPKEIHNDVTGYLLYTEGLLNSQKELETFLSMISKQLKEKVTKHIFTLALKDSEVFKGRKLLIESLTKWLAIRTCMPEEIIVTQGDKPDDVYFIAKGGCNVYVNNRACLISKSNVLKEGDYFGEVAVINQWNRTATVRSNNYSTLVHVNGFQFLSVFEKHPENLKMLKEKRRTYQDEWKKFLVSNIKNVEYLKNGSDVLLEELYFDLKEEAFKEGDVIFKAGDVVDRIYFIAEGEIEIFIKTYKIEISIDTLFQGCSIGEYGVLGECVFMFTAKTKSNFLKLFSISKSSVRSLLFSHKELKGDADRCTAPPPKDSELFLDFRVCRTESKKSRIKKVVKLSVLRYLRIVKIFGMDFSFKTFDPTKEK